MNNAKESPSVEPTPLMREMLDCLKNKTAGIEMTSEAIKTRIGYIDGNSPTEKEKSPQVSPNCLYDELSGILNRLDNIEDLLASCSNRLQNQLG